MTYESSIVSQRYSGGPAEESEAARVIMGQLLNGLETTLFPGQRPNLRQRLRERKKALEKALDNVSERLARVTAELEELERYPDADPFEDGTILKFVKRYRDGEKTYTYVAHRVDGLWYVSGSRAPQGVSWDRFVDFMGVGVVDGVWHVNATKKAGDGTLQTVEQQVF